MISTHLDPTTNENLSTKGLTTGAYNLNFQVTGSTASYAGRSKLNKRVDRVSPLTRFQR
jgi:hypothetical protein